MERRFYEQWSSGSRQSKNSIHRKRSSPGSPLQDSYSDRKQSYYDSSLLSEVKKMKDIDFEKGRREIDEEMKRLEEMERKQSLEEKQETISAACNGTNGIAKEDLRIMLEKCRDAGLRNVKPPLVPAPTDESRKNFGGNNPVFCTLASFYDEKIPGFDYDRLGSGDANKRPLGIFCGKGSEITEESIMMKREDLAKNFERDCDTVALVTQMLMDENPSLEKPLVEALNGVLRKVRRKHTELLLR